MSPALANFLFEAANLLLLAAGLGWLLFRPVRRLLDEERERRAAGEQEAREQRDEAAALMKEARAARRAADEEADRRRGEEEQQRRLEEARRAANAREEQQAARAALERELATARREQTAALADEVGRVAGEAVQRLLAQLDGPSLDLALARGAREELARLGAGGEARVESARPLDDETRELIREALGADVEEHVVPELGAGVRVTTSAGQVDASAASVAREAARAIGAAVGEEPGDAKAGDARGGDAEPGDG